MLQKLLASLSILLLSLLASPISQAAFYQSPQGCQHSFLDIVGHWSEEDVCTLYQNGVVQGYSERNYLPNQEVTKAEFVKIALLHLGYTVEPVQRSRFNDVKTGSWYYRYVSFAEDHGFLDYYTSSTFRPNNEITRAEAAVIMINIAGIIDYQGNSAVNYFTDLNASDWYAYAIEAAYQEGIITGYTDRTFRGSETITRAEAAALAQKTWLNLYN